MATSELKVRITAVDHASAVLKSLQSGIIRLVGAVASIVAAFHAITFPAQEAARFEREMINVAKTTNFSTRQIDGLSVSLLDMSKVMGTSATDLANIAAIAGQLGLGSFGVESIREFTESVAKATDTLGLSAEAAAILGAQLTSIFKIDPGNVEQVFSMLNALSNTSVASATELGDAIKRIGSIGGVTIQQSGALVAFFKDMGVQTEVLGTSTVKAFSNMSAKAKLFADVAGLSVQKWLELMEQDAVGALTTVTTKLYEMDRAQRDATAKELFGGGRNLSTYTKLIDSASDGYKRLYGHLDTANNSYTSGISSIEEYAKVMKSLTKQSKIMQDSMRALAIEMGDNLTPVILNAVKAMQEFLASAEGQDFLLQMANGIKSVLQGVVDLVKYVADLEISWQNVLQVIKVLGAALILKGVSGFVIGLTNGVLNMVTALNGYYTALLATFGAVASGTASSAASTAASSAIIVDSLNASTTARSAEAIATQKATAITAQAATVAKADAAASVTAIQSKLTAINSLNLARLRESIAQTEVNRVEQISNVTAASLNTSRSRLTIATYEVDSAERALAAATTATSLAQEKAAISQIKLTAARAKSAAAQAALAGSSVVTGAVANLGALGTPLVVAAQKTSLLTKAVGLLKLAFRSLLGPLGLILAGLYMFKDSIADALGFETAIEIDYKAEMRIDRRELEKEYKKATNIILETGQKVMDSLDVVLEFPVSTAPVVDKVAFANQLDAQFKEAFSVYEAANTMQDQLEKAITNSLTDIDIGVKVNVAEIYGDDVTKRWVEGIKDYKNEIDSLSEAIAHMPETDSEGDRYSQAKAELKGLQVIYDNLLQSVSDKIDFDFETGSAEELTVIIGKLKTDFIELGDTLSVEEYEAFETMLSQVIAIEQAAEYSEAALTKMSQASAGFDKVLGIEKTDEIIAITLELREVEAHRAKALKASDGDAIKRQEEILKLTNKLTDAQKRYKEEYDKVTIGTTLAPDQKMARRAINSWIDDLKRLKEASKSAYVSIAAAGAAAIIDSKRIADLEKQLSKEKGKEATQAAKVAIDSMAKTNKAGLEGFKISQKIAREEKALADAKIAAANKAGAEYALANNTDFVAQEATPDNTTETRNAALLDQLDEMIIKRAALSNLMDEYDDKTKDALDTAKQFDGAFDNSEKTLRSMRNSMDNFGKSLDEIVRKRKAANANKEVDLGIDKDLKLELREINEEYDKLIKEVEGASTLDTGSLSFFSGSDLGSIEDNVQALKDERDEAIALSREKARLAKVDADRVVAISDVTRSLATQKEEQNNLNKLIEKFNAIQASGGFEGVDGIQKYNEAMIELKEQTLLVSDASKAARGSLGDLGKIEGTSDGTIANYTNEMKALDKESIKLVDSQIALGKSLADSTVALTSGERMKLYEPYSYLNNEIGNLTKNTPGATALIKKMDVEALKTTKGVTSLGDSISDTTAKILEMSNSGASFSDLFNQTDKLKTQFGELGGLMRSGTGIAATDVQVGLVLKVGAGDDLQQQVDNVLNTKGATYETALVVTDVVNADGSKGFAINDVKISPDKKELEGSLSAIVQGKTYHFIADDYVLMESLKKSFVKEFELKANVTITNSPTISATVSSAQNTGGYIAVQNNATGGSIQSNAGGGSIRGQGTSMSDSILSWLSNGEYVIRASMVSKFGKGFFDMVNAGKLPAFASGGLSGSSSSSSSTVAATDSIDLNFNVGGKTYTLHGERQQAKAIVNMFKNMDRG